MKSLKAAGVDERQHYRWLEVDDWYLAAFIRAREAVSDLVESEILRRSIEGREEPVSRCSTIAQAR